MKHKLLQSLVLLALLALVLGLLAGCGKKGEEPAPGTTDVGGGTTEGNGYGDNLPEDLRFDGEVVHVLTWNETRDDDWYSAASSETIPHAVYTSREVVAERFNLSFDVVAQNGSWDFRNEFIANLRAYIQTGLQLDLIGQYTPAAALGAMNDLYTNLNELPYLDLGNPWWPGNIQESCSIGDNVYFCSGDITPTCVTAIGSVFVNLDLWESYGIEENVFDLVNKREWTMDKMQELVLGVVGNSGDYGIVMANRGIYDNLFYAGGLTYVDHDEDNQLIMSPDISGQKMSDWYDTCHDLLYDNEDVAAGDDVNGLTIENTFMTQDALIYMSQVMTDARDYLKDAAFDFAVVPYPMADSQQENYRSITGYWVTMFSVPSTARNPELSGAVLEALGSSSYTHLTPKVYEESFQHRFLQTPENAEMLDLIHDSIVYDSGRLFADDIAMFNLFRNAYYDTEWRTLYGERYTIWMANIERVTVKLG